MFSGLRAPARGPRLRWGVRSGGYAASSTEPGPCQAYHICVPSCTGVLPVQALALSDDCRISTTQHLDSEGGDESEAESIPPGGGGTVTRSRNRSLGGESCRTVTEGYSD